MIVQKELRIKHHKDCYLGEILNLLRPQVTYDYQFNEDVLGEFSAVYCVTWLRQVYHLASECCNKRSNQ